MTAAPTKKWGHDELQDDLAEHLRGSTDRMVWANMQMGPSGSPRPDVYTIEKSYSNFRPLAYECKISASDFRSDVTAGKWQSYLKFSSGVVFAAPAGLLSKADVPSTCGLILRHGECWRYAKKPVLTPIATLERDAWIKLLIDGVNRAAERRARDWSATWKMEDALRKRVGNDIAEYVRDSEHARERLASVQEKARAAEAAAMAAQEKAERGEVAAYAEIRRRLAVALHMGEETSLQQIALHIEDRLASLLAAMRADSEVIRLQGMLDTLLKAVRMAHVDTDPATMPVPYWWHHHQEHLKPKEPADAEPQPSV